MVILFVLPSVVIKIYINSDSFRNRISEEINKRVKFENLLLSYSIGEIGIFSGVEFIKIQLSDKNGKVAELNNCHIRGIERKILLQQNSFSVYCRKGIADIEFFEREGRQGSKISQEGRKSNYNIFVKIESFEVFYRKMRAEFELSGKYSNSEKYIEIELKDKYRIRITDIDFGKKSAKISFSDIDIPFLLERYMGRYAGLVNGKLGGSVIARKKGQEIEVEFSDVMVRNMSLTHPLVGEKPFAIKKFLLNGRFSVSVASGLLRLNELEADISEMNFLVSGRFYKGQYSFDFLTKRLMLNDLALFFGGEEFEGFDMKGEIKIKASVIGNISQVKKIEKISIYGDVIN
ncbi:MAG: hypothetical protein N3B13_08870, partial [Deltaproteobacteria bacterium]|nr:hypothetical protein [Deltaproteobacteria bacterium]